jgi:1-phosphofructokinase family hexose kinase
MHITVLALNPAVDVELRVRRIRWEEKNVIESERRWPGGKGVNVARWITRLRSHPFLLVTLGGASGQEMESVLRRDGMRLGVVRLREPTRTNLIITSESGQLRFNPPGPRISRTQWREVLRQMDKTAPRSSAFVLSGSLPHGVPSTAYAELIRHAHRWNKPVCLDCDGAAFEAAVRARPFLAKPNERELEEWWQRPLRSETAVIKAARSLAALTQGWVLVSRGRAGAVLVNALETVVLAATGPRIRARNTVGAGDAMLAAVAIQIIQKTPPDEWLRWGVATGSAAVRVAPGELPPLRLVRQLAGRIRIVQR